MIKEHDMIQERILELVKYGLTTGLVDPADEVYTVNRLLEVLGVDDIEDETFEKAAAQPAWTQEEAEEKLEGIRGYDDIRIRQWHHEGKQHCIQGPF